MRHQRFRMDHGLAIMGCLLLAAGLAAAASLPYIDGFEGYAEDDPVSGIGQGWGASAASVLVQTNTVFAGDKAVIYPNGTSLSNDVTSAGEKKIWTDLRLKPVFGVPPDDVPDASESVRLTVESNGFVRIWGPGGASELCTSNVWFQSVTGLTEGVWVRLSVFNDYDKKQSAVFLNGQLLRQQWPFAGAGASDYDWLYSRTESESAYLDDVYLSTNYPPTLSNDWDNDGNIDAAMIQQLGYVNITRRVGPGQLYATIQDALDAANPGDTVWLAAGTYTEDVSITQLVYFAGNSFSLNGDATVSSGLTIVWPNNVTVTSNLTVGAASDLGVSNATLIVDTLTIGSGGTVVVTDGTVTADGLTLEGSFTLDDSWGAGLVPSTLDFSDGFELYGNGSRIDQLGTWGWNGSSSVVVQQATVHGGNKALEAPGAALFSNTVDSASVTQVWTDVYMLPLLGGAPLDSAAADDSLRIYFGTNGYMHVDTGSGWDECSTNFLGDAVAKVSNAWVRVTILSNYDRKQAAVFLDGELVRQVIPFPGVNALAYKALMVDNPSETAFLDDVAISTAIPSALPSDVDGDGYSDAWELHHYGDITVYPAGSMFKLW